MPPAVLAENVADVGNGAVLVICRHINKYGHAARPIAFVHDLFIDRAIHFARAALNAALDVVLRHAVVARLLDGEAQTQVVIGVAATVLGRHDDLFGDFGEQVAALGVPARPCAGGYYAIWNVLT